MKRSTVNSSMRRTTKIITLTLIITVAVGLLLLASTTVDAAFFDYNYITCLTDASGNSTVYLSQDPIHVYCVARDMTSYSGSYYYFLGSSTDKNLVELVYSTSLNQWVTNAIRTPGELNGISSLYIMDTRTSADRGSFVPLYGGVGSSSFYQLFSCITNGSMNSTERNAFTSWSGDISSLPEGLTEERVNEIIDEQINTSTSSGQAAQTIINNTTNQYNLYLAGDISSDQMQQNVTDNINALNDLTPSTLLDAMQINNGLTYNQAIQDELLNTASSDVRSQVASILASASDWLYRYRQGEQPQNIVQNQLRQRSVELNDLIKNGVATTTADIEVISAALQTVGNYIDIVAGYSDVDQEISDKSQASDQAELDYLDEITAETTATVEQIAPSKNFTSGQTGEAQEVLNLIWENEFVKRLLPMCAGFMVVCVVLGIRYKV